MTSSAQKAFISWAIDALGTITVLVLLFSWTSDLQAPDESTYLSKSFLQNGFCLSPRFNDTHFSCSVFDAICGAFCIVSVLSGKIPSSSLGIASYFLAHSYGHYSVSQGNASPEGEVMRPDELITLSAILAIGPLTSASFLVKAKKMTQTNASVFAAVSLACMVSVYAFMIQNAKFALLYINISIILTMSLPKMLLVGFASKEDVAIQTERFHWAKVATSLFVLWVVFCEPFFCDSFVSSIGGHFVFDFSLAADAMVDTFLVKDGDKTTLEGSLKTKTK